MDDINCDNPGDCRIVARADSTTTRTNTTTVNMPPTITTREGLRRHQQNHHQQQQQQQQQQEQQFIVEAHQQQVSSTTATRTAASTERGIQKSSTSPTPTSSANVVVVVGTNSKSPPPPPNKLKSQQQQQQHQQHHQFRAPQPQFVKQSKNTAAATLKKQKTWSKRQHNKMCKQNVAANLIGSGHVLVMGNGGGGGGGVISNAPTLVGGGMGGGGGIALGNITSNKADLENIQNIKNQIHHHHHGRLTVGGGAGGSGINLVTQGNIGGGTVCVQPPPSLGGLEKMGHCHGHLKPQAYKKILAHGRGNGHHNHVLCAGAAHNTQAQCCLANGCSAVVVNDKDNSSNSGSSVVSNASAQHYCCGRAKFFLPEKRIRKEVIVPPTKFLLGGNISDPLNLNSLQNESSSNANSTNNTPGTTPRQSPITTPPKVEVIIPPNIHDPLHLLDPVDSMEYEKQLTSPMKRGCGGGLVRGGGGGGGGGGHLKVTHHGNKHRNRKNRKRRSRNDSETSMNNNNNNTSVLNNSTLTTGETKISSSSVLVASAQQQIPANIAASLAALTTTTTPIALPTIEAATTTVVPSLLSISLGDDGNVVGSGNELLLLKGENAEKNNLLINISGGGGGGDGNERYIKATTIPSYETSEVLNVSKHFDDASNSGTAGGIPTEAVSPSKRRRCSPIAPMPAAITLVSESLTRAAVKRLELETELAPSSSKIIQQQQYQQQHVEPNSDIMLLTTMAAESTTAAAAVAAALKHTVAAAAASRKLDLHLDLNNSCSSNNSSTCCSSGLGGGGGGGGVGFGFGGRKRKISESNNSQKSKKFHRHDALDKIVSPVVPQPGAWKRPPRLQPTGARKTNMRRSVSFNETELLSPVDVDKQVPSSAIEIEIPGRDDTLEFPKNDLGLVEPCLGSPLSTISGATSLTAGEQDSLNEVSISGDTNNALIEVVKPENLTTAITATAAVTIPPPTMAVMLNKLPKFRADGIKYRYGNFDRYADYRQLNDFRDVRLQVFQRHLELFQNKDILDIGCNVGHMTITVGRNLAPKSILGIDIDRELVARARRNLAMFVRIPVESFNKSVVQKEKKLLSAPTEGDDGDGDGDDNGVIKKHKKTRRKKRRRAGGVNNNGVIGNHLQLHHLLHHHHHHHHHHHIHHYLSQQEQIQQKKLQELHVNAKEFFPISFPLVYGGIPNTANVVLPKINKFEKTPNAATAAMVATATESPSSTNCETSTAAIVTSTTTSSSVNVVESSGVATVTTSSPASTTNNATNAVNSSWAVEATSSQQRKNNFPQNVYFRNTNYVLKDEALLANDTQQYDLILCLSVTKWIHLNYGDAGLKLVFRRMFNQLRPGGKLILEAQNWASYKKKKNLTPEIYENYKKIEFFPNKFHEYLLSAEVGFSHSYTLGVPRHMNKGFSRPIQLYAKGDYTPNHVRWSDAYYPQTPYEAYRGIYATTIPRPLDSGSGGGGSGASIIFNLGSSRSQNYDTPHYTGGGGSASGSYSCRQTPMHQPTSQYYNPLETDSYQPSYDTEYLNHMYVFASPLYQTVWSPPASLRKSSSHTPVFGSVREAELDGDGSLGASGGGSGGSGGSSYHRHVYPPNDETCSPNANAGNAFNSIRDPDTDDSNQLPGGSQHRHVYATNCGESSSSPQVNLHESETIESLMLDADEQ